MKEIIFDTLKFSCIFWNFSAYSIKYYANLCAYFRFSAFSVHINPNSTDEKCKNILFDLHDCSIRHFANLLGLLTLACPAVPYRLAHKKKFLTLMATGNNYDR